MCEEKGKEGEKKESKREQGSKREREERSRRSYLADIINRLLEKVNWGNAQDVATFISFLNCCRIDPCLKLPCLWGASQADAGYWGEIHYPIPPPFPPCPSPPLFPSPLFLLIPPFPTWLLPSLYLASPPSPPFPNASRLLSPLPSFHMAGLSWEAYGRREEERERRR